MRHSGKRQVGPSVYIDVIDGGQVTESAEEYERRMQEEMSGIYRDGLDVWRTEDVVRAPYRYLAGVLGDAIGGCRVLDIGCGRGVDVAALAAAGAVATGVDIVRFPEWEGIRQRNPGARFLHGNLIELSREGHLPDEHFDAAIDTGCTHHQHPERITPFVESVHRTLRAGATLVIETFGAEAGGVLMRNEMGRLYRDYTVAEFTGFLGDHGFRSQVVHKLSRGPGLHCLVGVFTRV
ncbi:methyltransferase domain-containing protein [Amycolatopsis sp. NPDC059021]|uniref:methyltransferase domain-containing protein n=1 Tax=Amycolatopsis sp. NPDC059021 TaxID=3346704 RepID=UPI00366C0178